MPFMDQIEPAKNWNCLTSFQYKECLRGFKPQDFKNFMADSGAFTAMNAGKKIDAKYIDDYIAWIKANDIKNFVEMDLDEIIGYDKTLEIRKYIEHETNALPIPVWHFERGEQGWKEMCAKRLQLQERLAEDIAECISIATQSEDVFVNIVADHACVSARGAKNDGVTDVTALKGRFLVDQKLRDEIERKITRI